jgi:hypothetical protein
MNESLHLVLGSKLRSRFSSLWYIPGVEVVLNALIIISKTNRNQALATWKNMMDQSEPAADGEGHKINGKKKYVEKHVVVD